MTVVILAITGCSSEPGARIWEISGPVFGTQYHVKVVLPEDSSRLKSLSRGISRELESVDAGMSTWRDDSELSQFNERDQASGDTNGKGEWFAVSEPLLKVITEAQRVSSMTNGAFDITIGPVVNLWGFGPRARPEKQPDSEVLAKRLAQTGYEKLTVRQSPPAIRSSAPLYLDLSAIAKGYAVDAVASYLKREGVDNLLVEIGGEVSAQGVKPSGETWRLAIEKPISTGRAVQQVVALNDHAMATSGDYRNYYEAEGRRYSHTIDPATGKPITHQLASVTVIADSAMTADALATALNVMGDERGYTFAVEHDMAAYFIYRDAEAFEWRYTPAFSSYLTN
jgi:thiamine biosynthesis lipoprotein